MTKSIYTTPQQAIKHIVLQKHYGKSLSVSSVEEIDDIFDELKDGDIIWDLMSEVREGDIETNITPPISRHYETKSVASQTPNGLWVGWTYWYGGGKHGNPEEIDWVGDAYFLNLIKEEDVTVTVREFEKLENNNA
ncbi:hypothetical protein [Xenorhabdus sp. BG5]|uniref:hypothetical protein n=1 Tax=Xenorhabdus sp. BG5 TaxID=2782014 RepID=UPI0018818746|nr:hypothetical protein [Xenorhabdus sp. BG5]MBE8597869.1 hypothetical protein [Xenorhabdus sp. BG5]